MSFDFPDYDRILAEHDPSLEPYASMSRDELWALMQRPGIAPTEWAWLEQFFLDKLPPKELEIHTRSHEIATFLMNLYDIHGDAQAIFMARVASRLALMIAAKMPPIGKPEVCN